MTRNKPTVDKQARELASDPQFNIALEASAGTGKTRVLVDRYVRLVENGTSPRHILAITFTRKAASEMRSRVIEELQARPTLWSELKPRLFEMHINTIDAFCQGLLREFPLEAGIDPGFNLVDEVEKNQLLQEAVELSLADSKSHEIDLPFLIKHFSDVRLRKGVRDSLTNHFIKEKLVSKYPEKVPPKKIILSKSLRRFSDLLNTAFKGEIALDKFLQHIPVQLDTLKFALKRAVCSDLITPADIESLIPYFLTLEHKPRQRLLQTYNKSSFSSPETYEKHRNQIFEICPYIAKAYKQWLRDKDFYAISQLSKLYHLASVKFSELKRSNACLDFEDTLLTAVTLLEQRGEFAQSRFRLESRYHHLLVDEFQDTNEIQWRLIRALIESWGEGQSLVQDSILSEQAKGTGTGKLQEPTLFIVGDRKQSIYGWRNARVEVMETVSNHLMKIRPGGGKQLTLQTSFRASGELLKFINDLFSQLPKVSPKFDWSFQYRETDHFPINANKNDAKPIGIAAERNLRDVADRVADEVSRVLSEEKCQPRDIAILFRNRSSYRVYEDALTKREIPTYVYRGLGFFDSPEVRDIGALINYLAEPESKLRAAALARTRFIGISDTALLLMSAGPNYKLTDWFTGIQSNSSLPCSDSDQEAIRRSTSLVPKWLALVDRVPPADLIEHVLYETDYGAWFKRDQHGWENLKKVMEIVRRAQNRGYLTMHRLSEYLASASTGEESPAVLDAINAVNLMTVHAAKGLEFDTVFLVNMHKRTKQDIALPKIKELPDGQFEIRAISPTELQDDYPNRVVEEEKRLLYVALTRARKNLILATVFPTAKKKDQSLFHLLPGSLKDIFTSALETNYDEATWGEHSLRILRPIQKQTTYHESSHEHRNVARKISINSATLHPYLPVFKLDAPALTKRQIALSKHKELTQLFASGDVKYRVSFSVKENDQIHRGVMNCIVTTPKLVTIVDWEHCPSEMLMLKFRAAQGLFPGRKVNSLLLSKDDTTLEIDPKLSL